MRIGAAPASWGVWFADDPKQPPWQRYLDEVVEAGYRWIELGPYGYLPTEVSILQAELARRRLKVSAAQVTDVLEEPSVWPALQEKVLRVGELLAGLGGEYLILLDKTYTDAATYQRTAPIRLDRSAWRRLIDNTHNVADIARGEFGLKLLFEPHTASHVEYVDQIETLLHHTDSDRVSLCLDIGHCAYRGGDPVSLVREHRHRICYLHLKNVDPEVKRKVEAEGIPFQAAVGMGVFCELSQGSVDVVALRNLLSEIDYDGWVIVEQGMYPAPFDKPLPIAKRNLAYLRKLGFE